MIAAPIPEEAKTFYDEQGLLKAWPAKGREKVRAHVLQWLAGHFSAEEVLTEKEVSQRLRELHTFDDPASLRREMIVQGLLVRSRDCRGYRRA
jgi:hypothetical protein